MATTIAVKTMTGKFVLAGKSALKGAGPCQAEYPISPARLFKALTAAWGGDEEPDEALALRWLEKFPTPAIYAPKASVRPALLQFVPVNDLEYKGGVVTGSYPFPRLRMGRQFHAYHVPPGDEAFYFTFPEDVPSDLREPLERVCSKVVSVGHSTSVVQVYLSEPVKEPNFLPNGSGSGVECPTAGYLDYLQDCHAKGERPNRSKQVLYGPPQPPVQDVLQTTFDPAIFIATLRQRERTHILGPEHVLTLMETLRDSVMSKAGLVPCPDFISGHTEDGSVAKRNHLAFMPIPNVGHTHADGLIKGVGFALPRDMLQAERRTILRTLERLEVIDMSRKGLGVWSVSFETLKEEPVYQRTSTWTQPSRAWSTVTPYVYDHRGKDLIRGITESCRYIGLPKPKHVQTSSFSDFIGVPSVRDFAPYRVKDTPRSMTHLYLEFDEPVTGPLLVGAGRFKGYGVMRPVEAFR